MLVDLSFMAVPFAEPACSIWEELVYTRLFSYEWQIKELGEGSLYEWQGKDLK